MKPLRLDQDASGKQTIFDVVRKKFVVLTAEEWVRQQILQHLIESMHYPAALISVERQIRVGSRNRRYDIVVYSNDTPWMVIECKRETELLTQQTLGQVLAYNVALQVEFLCISNGRQVFTYDVSAGAWIHRFPEYPR